MCGFGRKYNAPSKFLSFEDFVSLYDKLGNHAEKVRLNGRGESTIHPDLKKIIRYIGHKNRMSLFTNGNYIDKELNDLFLEFDVELYFSIDSPNPAKLEEIRKGVNYERLNHNIQEMKSKETRPFLVFTLQECNIDDIVSIAHYAIKHQCNLIYNVLRRDVGIEAFQGLIVQNKAKIINDFQIVEDLFAGSNVQVYSPDQISGIEIRKSGCSLTCGPMERCPNISKELCVLYNGDVTPCNMFNPYVYGNIRESDIESILSGVKRRWFEENHKTYYYCQNCACLVR